MKKKFKNVWALPIILVISLMGLIINVLIILNTEILSTTTIQESLGPISLLFIIQILFMLMGIVVASEHDKEKPFTYREVLYPADPKNLTPGKVYYINGDIEAAFLGSTRSSKLHVFGNISGWPNNEILILTSWQVKSHVAIHEELVVGKT